MRIEDLGAATLINADCLDAMAVMPENAFDSIVCDPPYGLGFMGKAWDHGVPGAPYWAAALRVTKPGAYMLAFGGTRTHHRLMCAIEDAGWEIRDVVMWVYGSGFPKSHNGAWGGTALKPAWEPIILARKPLVGTVAENVGRYGTGGLNIDGCRVETLENLNGGAYSQSKQNDGEWGTMHRAVPDAAFQQPDGRWPANLIHDGSDEVVDAFPNAKGQLAAAVVGGETNKNGILSPMERAPTTPQPRNDTGSAARFFYCVKASKADRDEGCEALADKLVGMSNAAAAAAKRGEMYDSGGSGANQVKVRKNTHPTVKPTELMRYCCKLITPAGGTVLDPFMGSGSTGKAAMLEGFGFVGVELDTEHGYFDIAGARIRAAMK